VYAVAPQNDTDIGRWSAGGSIENMCA